MIKKTNLSFLIGALLCSSLSFTSIYTQAGPRPDSLYDISEYTNTNIWKGKDGSYIQIGSLDAPSGNVSVEVMQRVGPYCILDPRDDSSAESILDSMVSFYDEDDEGNITIKIEAKEEIEYKGQSKLPCTKKEPQSAEQYKDLLKDFKVYMNNFYPESLEKDWNQYKIEDDKDPRQAFISQATRLLKKFKEPELLTFKQYTADFKLDSTLEGKKVDYLRLFNFSSYEKELTQALLKNLNKSDALIVDLRFSHGSLGQDTKMAAFGLIETLIDWKLNSKRKIQNTPASQSEPEVYKKPVVILVSALPENERNSVYGKFIQDIKMINAYLEQVSDSRNSVKIVEAGGSFKAMYAADNPAFDEAFELIKSELSTN
tara:strand:- start:2096 stop:3211 length:1116 start_codon:yes stop_codon:yes gene_type:complete